MKRSSYVITALVIIWIATSINYSLTTETIGGSQSHSGSGSSGGTIFFPGSFGGGGSSGGHK